MIKTISILGSTGSIGLTSLDIIEKKKNFFKVYLLSANKNYVITRQIKKYKPVILAIIQFCFKRNKSKKTLIVNQIDHNFIKKKN